MATLEKHTQGLLSFNYSSRMLSSLLTYCSTIGKILRYGLCSQHVDISAPFIMMV